MQPGAKRRIVDPVTVECGEGLVGQVAGGRIDRRVGRRFDGERRLAQQARVGCGPGIVGCARAAATAAARSLEKARCAGELQRRTRTCSARRPPLSPAAAARCDTAGHPPRMPAGGPPRPRREPPKPAPSLRLQPVRRVPSAGRGRPSVRSCQVAAGTASVRARRRPTVVQCARGQRCRGNSRPRHGSARVRTGSSRRSRRRARSTGCSRWLHRRRRTGRCRSGRAPPRLRGARSGARRSPPPRGNFGSSRRTALRASDDKVGNGRRGAPRVQVPSANARASPRTKSGFPPVTSATSRARSSATPTSTINESWVRTSFSARPRRSNRAAPLTRIKRREGS